MRSVFFGRVWAWVLLGGVVAVSGVDLRSSRAQGVPAFARERETAALPTDPSVDIPLNTPLDRLKSWRTQAESRFNANKVKREAAYKEMSALQRKLFQAGASVQAKRRESSGFDAALVSAKLAGDQRQEHTLKDRKTRSEKALETQEKEFARVVVDLEKKANEMGQWLLEERRYEARMRTLDDRIYIMELRKLAAGGAP